MGANTELLISRNWSEPNDVENQAEVRPRVLGFSGGQFGTKVLKDFGVRHGRQRVHPDRQRLVFLVGAEIDRAVEHLPHQSPRVVQTRELFPDDVDQSGLRSVGDQLNGVHEMFLGGALMVKEQRRCWLSNPSAQKLEGPKRPSHQVGRLIFS